MPEPRRPGRPPSDAALVEEALRLIAEEKLSPVEAAERVGVGKSTVYNWLKARGTDAASVARPPPRPAAPPRRSATGPKAPTASSPADEAVGRAADIAAAANDVDAMGIMIEVLAHRLEAAPEGRIGPIASTLAGLIAKRAKLRPPPPPSADELERRAKPLADEVLEAIEKQVRAAEEALGLP